MFKLLRYNGYRMESVSRSPGKESGASRSPAIVVHEMVGAFTIRDIQGVLSGASKLLQADLTDPQKKRLEDLEKKNQIFEEN